MICSRKLPCMLLVEQSKIWFHFTQQKRVCDLLQEEALLSQKVDFHMYHSISLTHTPPPENIQWVVANFNIMLLRNQTRANLQCARTREDHRKARAQETMKGG